MTDIQRIRTSYSFCNFVSIDYRVTINEHINLDVMGNSYDLKIGDFLYVTVLDNQIHRILKVIK